MGKISWGKLAGAVALSLGAAFLGVKAFSKKANPNEELLLDGECDGDYTTYDEESAEPVEE